MYITSVLRLGCFVVSEFRMISTFRQPKDEIILNSNSTNQLKEQNALSGRESHKQLVLGLCMFVNMLIQTKIKIYI